MSPTTRLPYAAPSTPAEAFKVWKMGVMVFELWSASLSTIALRQSLWCTQSPTSEKMTRENERMMTEKLDAGLEVGMAMQETLFDMCSGQYAPWWVTGRRALKPLHRRSVANSRRLSRA